jgi:hypothetical protein
LAGKYRVPKKGNGKLDYSKVKEVRPPNNLRPIKSHPWMSVLTGSHAYGTPNEESDIDLVVLLPRADIQKLISQTDSKYAGNMTDMTDTVAGSDSGPFACTLRFGKLNLICCFTVESFKIWAEGTQFLKKRAPVTRDEAIECLAAERKARLHK